MTGGARFYPVNLEPAVRCLGAELLEREGLGSGLVGALVDKRADGAPVIFANTSETIFWQRFNVACMLGHIIPSPHTFRPAKSLILIPLGRTRIPDIETSHSLKPLDMLFLFLLVFIPAGT